MTIVIEAYDKHRDHEFKVVFLHNGLQASCQSQTGFLAFSLIQKPTLYSPWVLLRMV